MKLKLFSKKLTLILLILFIVIFSFSCSGEGTTTSAIITSNTPLTDIEYPIAEFQVTEREATIATDGNEVELNIFTTNDEHGWITDWDYGSGKPRESRGNPKPSGLARVSTMYKKLSAENPNSMLVSSGDSIQGTILSYYFNFLAPEKLNPISAIFSKMGYEFWAVGNHEVEQGNNVMLKVAKEFKENGIAVLSANAIWSNNPEAPYYLPYYVKEIDGVRIGFLGMTTPGIPMWLADTTHENHEFIDMVEAAKKYVPVIREQEKVDVLIGIFHSGMNEEYDISKATAAGVPAPNASRLVAQEIGGGSTGFDAIVTAHSHKIIDDTQNTEFKEETSNIVNGVKLIQAKNWGERLGHLKIKVVGENSKWVVKEINAITYSMENVAEDPEILDYMKKYVDGAKKYAATTVGQATDELLGLRSYYEESEIVDLIHETQRHFSKAEISIAATFNASLIIPKGDITVGQIAGIYIYENFLNAVELTGHQIKNYLEYSSKYFNVITEANVDTVPLVNPDVRGYNYDMAQGFIYEINLTKEPGNRIINMKNMDGTPFDLEKTYNVTLNSYRYNGGGGHLEACEAMEKGILKVNTTYRSELAMRDLMIEYLKIVKTWGPENIEQNWKLVPEDLAARAIENQLATGG